VVWLVEFLDLSLPLTKGESSIWSTTLMTPVWVSTFLAHMPKLTWTKFYLQKKTPLLISSDIILKEIAVYSEIYYPEIIPICIYNYISPFRLYCRYFRFFLFDQIIIENKRREKFVVYSVGKNSTALFLILYCLERAFV